MFNAYINSQIIHSMNMCSHASVGLMLDIFLENSSLYTLRQRICLPRSHQFCTVLLDSCTGNLLPLAHKGWACEQAAVLTSIYMSSGDLALRASHVSSKLFAHWVNSKAQVSYFDKILSFLFNKWECDPCHLQLFQFKIAPIGGSVCNQRT